jgi:hypothetical protein
LKDVKWGEQSVSGKADVGLPGQGRIEGIETQENLIRGWSTLKGIASGEMYPE